MQNVLHCKPGLASTRSVEVDHKAATANTGTDVKQMKCFTCSSDQQPRVTQRLYLCLHILQRGKTDFQIYGAANRGVKYNPSVQKGVGVIKYNIIDNIILVVSLMGYLCFLIYSVSVHHFN